MKIYVYQKKSDAYTTYQAQGTEEAPVVELCTLDGLTYISGPDELPPQPEQVAVEPALLTPELRERIKTKSPQCRLIYKRMEEQIRQRYSPEDEIFLTRIGVGKALGIYAMPPEEEQELSDYQAYVESVREWGRQEREDLGL